MNRRTLAKYLVVVNVILALLLLVNSSPALIHEALAKVSSAFLDFSTKFDQPSEEVQPQPATVAAVANPDQDTQIFSASEKIIVLVPKGAVASIVNIELKEFAPPTTTGMRMLTSFDLNATDAATGVTVTEFAKDIAITIKHIPEDLAGLDSDSVRLYYRSEATGQWLPVASSSYDRNSSELKATTTHFTHFGEMANPTIVGPGRVMAADVNLHSGAAIFSYPLELPPGPGGFQPKLELTYNSGSADEMKNKQSVGSWVGIGWSIDLGNISYDSTHSCPN